MGHKWDIKIRTMHNSFICNEKSPVGYGPFETCRRLWIDRPRGHERAKGAILLARETCQKRAKCAMIEGARKPAINPPNPPLRLPHGTANRLIKGSNRSWKSGINHKDRKEHKDFSPCIFSAFFAFSAVKYF